MMHFARRGFGKSHTLDERRHRRQRSVRSSSCLVQSMSKRAKISNIDIKRSLNVRLGVVVEEIGHSQFDRVICRSICGCRKQRREWRDRNVGDGIVLTESIEESILEFRCRRISPHN